MATTALDHLKSTLGFDASLFTEHYFLLAQDRCISLTAFLIGLRLFLRLLFLDAQRCLGLAAAVLVMRQVLRNESVGEFVLGYG